MGWAKEDSKERVQTGGNPHAVQGAWRAQAILPSLLLEGATVGGHGPKFAPALLMKLLKAVLFVELLVGGAWTLVVGAIGPRDLGVLTAFVAAAPIFLVAMAIGVWKAIREPESRSLAVWVILTPVAVLFLPSTLRTMFGDGVFTSDGGGKAWFLVAGAPLGLVLVRPRAVGAYLPRFVVQSRAFNLGVIGLLLITVGAIAVIGFAVLNPTLMEGATPFVAALVPIAVIGAIFSFVVILVAYIGFFHPDGRQRNVLRVIQLLLAIPIPLAVAAGFLAVAVLSYG